MTGEVEPVLAPPAAISFVGLIREQVVAGEAARQELADAGDWESLAWGLVRLKEARALLSDLLRAVEMDVYELMPDKRQTIEGAGTFEKRAGANRKAWQSDDLVKHLTRLALDPSGTGEIPGSPYEAADAVVKVLTECAPFTPSMGWRVTALRSYGLDPDEWCETSPGRQSIQIHGAVEQAALNANKEITE